MINFLNRIWSCTHRHRTENMELRVKQTSFGNVTLVNGENSTVIKDGPDRCKLLAQTD